MSEMSESSADSGSPDAPSADQPSAADDQTANAPEQPPPEMVSAPADDSPSPAEGTSKLVEPGKAAASTDAPQTAGAPNPAPPGKATARVRTNAPQAVSVAPPAAIHPSADPMAVRQLLDELAKRGTGGGGSALSELAALRALYPFEQVLCREDGSIATVFRPDDLAVPR